MDGKPPGTIEEAIAAITEVQRPIRPELPRGGLIVFVPTLVIAFLVIAVVVAALVLAQRYFYPGAPEFAAPAPVQQMPYNQYTNPYAPAPNRVVPNQLNQQRLR